MAKPLVTDELWEVIEPLIPKVKRRPQTRAHVSTTAACSAASSSLRTGIPWEYLPQEMGCGSGYDLLAAPARLAAGRRLGASARAAARQTAGCRTHRLVAGRGRQLPRARLWGGTATGPSPVHGARRGSKHHLICCGRGIPLAVRLTAANRNDVSEMIDLLDAIPAVRGRCGRPRRRPRRLYGDRAITPMRQGVSTPPRRPGEHRCAGKSAWLRTGPRPWVVERTIAGCTSTAACGPLRRRCDIHEAFLAIGCSLICLSLLLAPEPF